MPYRQKRERYQVKLPNRNDKDFWKKIIIEMVNFSFNKATIISRHTFETISSSTIYDVADAYYVDNVGNPTNIKYVGNQIETRPNQLKLIISYWFRNYLKTNINNNIIIPECIEVLINSLVISMSDKFINENQILLNDWRQYIPSTLEPSICNLTDRKKLFSSNHA